MNFNEFQWISLFVPFISLEFSGFQLISKNFYEFEWISNFNDFIKFHSIFIISLWFGPTRSKAEGRGFENIWPAGQDGMAGQRKDMPNQCENEINGKSDRMIRFHAEVPLTPCKTCGHTQFGLPCGVFLAGAFFLLTTAPLLFFPRRRLI